MSADLQWMLIKNNSAFLVKRDGIQMNKEKFNVMNVNSFKYSGLANEKAVDVSLDSDNKIVFSKKRPSAARKPKYIAGSNRLTKHRRNKTCRGAVAVRVATSGSYYRGDLANKAVARYHRLYRAIKHIKSVKKA